MNISTEIIEIPTSVDGARKLPKYFKECFSLVQQNLKGMLDITLPDGRAFRSIGEAGDNGKHASLVIHNDDLFARMIRDGSLAIGESYMDGWWTTPDLQAFLDLVTDTDHGLQRSFPGMGVLRGYERFRHWLRSNSKTQAKQNIQAHYDLGNEFYGKWLDPSMTYSSAYFGGGAYDLEAAQHAKYAAILDKLNVSPGEHVLEIGCGWGGFAEFAARNRGLKVTGLTLSPSQQSYAQERLAKAGLSDLVEIKLQDYRDETGQYDGIVSIEMFEAVGEKYWPTYFETLRRCLRPGRHGALQIITLRDDFMDHYRNHVDFIQKHIFPGGMLPGLSELDELVRAAGLEVISNVGFGQDYSKTLRLWDKSFSAAWPEIERLGFDERFKRMWRFYLCACAGSFAVGNCDVRHLQFAHPA